ncbi:MAG: hypothetical protein MZV64_36365 [Ignavibacteriales bacterium]|nr:hypothetical protein [Ignavibacteriales bacterium]
MTSLRPQITHTAVLALAAAVTLTASAAPATAQQKPAAAPRPQAAATQPKKPNIVVIIGGRCRRLEHQRLSPRHDGRAHAQH